MILIVVGQPVRAKYADDFPSLVEEFTTSSRAEPGCSLRLTRTSGANERGSA